MDKKLQILRKKNRRSVQSWLPNVVFYLQLCVLELLFDPGPRAAEAVISNGKDKLCLEVVETFC